MSVAALDDFSLPCLYIGGFSENGVGLHVQQGGHISVARSCIIMNITPHLSSLTGTRRNTNEVIKKRRSSWALIGIHHQNGVFSILSLRLAVCFRLGALFVCKDGCTGKRWDLRT